jgi:membrane-associated phospholipid phosphatase
VKRLYRILLLIFFVIYSGTTGLFSIGLVQDGPSIGLLDNWGENLKNSFWGTNLLFHGGAIGSTVLLVESGADREIQDFFQDKDPLGQNFSDTAIIVGNFWHFVPGLLVYWYGKSENDRKIAGAGAAGVQAVFTTSLVVLTKKILTGRKAPIQVDAKDGWLNVDEDVSKGSSDPGNFDFTFWNNFDESRFYWPSGHTASAFSFVSALTAYYGRDAGLIPWIGYPLALLMGISTIDGDYHWASDVLAGGLIGHVIGWTVGKSYRAQLTGEKEEQGITYHVVPLISANFKGGALEFRF